MTAVVVPLANVIGLRRVRSETSELIVPPVNVMVPNAERSRDDEGGRADGIAADVDERVVSLDGGRRRRRVLSPLNAKVPFVADEDHAAGPGDRPAEGGVDLEAGLDDMVHGSAAGAGAQEDRAASVSVSAAVVEAK